MKTSSDDEQAMTAAFRPRQRQSFHVTPIEAQGWVVWDDGKVEGPLRVVAAGTLIKLEDIGGLVVGIRSGKSNEYLHYEPDYMVPIQGDYVGRGSMDHAETFFMLLPEGPGEMDLWQSSQRVFFSEKAAHDAAPAIAERAAAVKGAFERAGLQT